MNSTTFRGRSKLGFSAAVRNASFLLALSGLLCLATPQLRADQEANEDPNQIQNQVQNQDQNQGQDPPTRVARVSYLDGTISMQPGGEGDWGNAAKNRPVTIGDKIWVDKDSRAELQAGQVTIHLGSMTALSFLNLDANITQMRLAEGSINFRVRELQQGDMVEVDAPNLAFVAKQAGEFRIDVDENGDAARVTVIRGEGEVAAGGKTYPVHAGEQAEFTGTDNITYTVQAAPAPDGLDNWSAQRDLKEDNSVSAKYVSRDMNGYSDLDDNGSWNQEPDYGNVWYPNAVDPGWAPYSTGYWNWVGPWGWTWVDYSSWGFAPFHYGRWAYIGSRWGWCPGPYYGRPIYGPAYVGFYGGGFAFGVGWFPLGFGEPYHPWFHASNRYVTNVNIHNTMIRNVNVISNSRNFNYRYAHNANAVTATSRNTFVNGQMINRGEFHVTQASLRGATVTNSVGLRPSQHSSLGMSNANPRIARPSAVVQNRAVLARTAPAAGASNLRVHTMDNRSLAPGRTNNAPARSVGNSSMTNPRQHELSQSRPPSATFGNARPTPGTMNTAPQQRANTNRSSARTWDAQGNSTDRGHAPAGFGSTNRRANVPTQADRMTRSDRPSWAGTSNAPANNSGSRTQNYPSGVRSYEPPQRTNRDTQQTYNGNRGASQQQGSYRPAPSNSAPRTYSPPSRSYPAPSRSNSAPPSRGSSGGGGGGNRGGGGGSPHGGGSVSHSRH